MIALSIALLLGGIAAVWTANQLHQHGAIGSLYLLSARLHSWADGLRYAQAVYQHYRSQAIAETPARVIETRPVLAREEA